MSPSSPAAGANFAVRFRLIIFRSPGKGRRTIARRPRQDLLAKVDHGEPTDTAGITRFYVIEIHSARDDLVVAIADVPGPLAAQLLRVVLENRDQNTAGGVDPDDRLGGQVDKPDDLFIRADFKLAGHVVRVRYRVHLFEVVFGGRPNQSRVSHVEANLEPLQRRRAYDGSEGVAARVGRFGTG